MSPQVALVLYCVEMDMDTHQCVQQAWMPAPSLLPPLTVEQAGMILSAAALCFATAWGVKLLVRHIRS